VDRSVFSQHFSDAARVALDFAKQYLEEPLPDEMRFRVHLNSSHDANAGAEFKLFPEDSSDDRALATKHLNEAGVVELLWRDGFVPQWVDLIVVGETGDTTILDVIACGRYADDERRLYYVETGLAPFSPKGPVLPVNHVDGRRFSIYERSSCWSLEDLERSRRNAAKVWSLKLHGPAFDDWRLACLPAFPRLEILEFFGVTLMGPGLEGLAGLPRLRHLRARLGDASRLDFSSLPVMPTLESLTVHFLPPSVENVARLTAALPRLKELALGSSRRPHSDGEVVIPSVERLTVDFPDLPTWISMPQSLRWLAVHAPNATDADLRRALSGCPEELDSLGLRGTPVSDALFADLERFQHLKYLDAVDTRITKEALRRFAERRPGFKCWPKLAGTVSN